MTRKPTERPPQFSLRRMLAVVALLASSLAVLRVVGVGAACCSFIGLGLMLVGIATDSRRYSPRQSWPTLVVAAVVGGLMGFILSAPTRLAPPPVPWHAGVALGALFGFVVGLAFAALGGVRK